MHLADYPSEHERILDGLPRQLSKSQKPLKPLKAIKGGKD